MRKELNINDILSTDKRGSDMVKCPCCAETFDKQDLMKPDLKSAFEKAEEYFNLLEIERIENPAKKELLCVSFLKIQRLRDLYIEAISELESFKETT